MNIQQGFLNDEGRTTLHHSKILVRYSLFFFIAALLGCEKDIIIEPAQTESTLVIEAQIENGQGPVVILSKSLNYFSTIDVAALNESYVRGAKVTITTGNRTYTLTEFKVPLVGGYFFYYYGQFAGTATPLYGDFGKKYDLRIETDGKVYTASTTIPMLTKRIDSLWWKKAPNNPDTTKAVLMARVTDPAGYGNYIRYFTKVNQDDFYPGRNSVYDDQIIDGKTYDVQIDQGITRNVKPAGEDYGYFKRGDTVTVKHCNIDKATYDFWRTWEFSYQSIGNPFSSPGKVISNISNGGLGSFCGYAVQYKTLIIPK
ncbi:MAG: DUF4249 domain-containing protein [Bacteroidota bacterium]